jgi:hypothetical protein
LTDQPLLCLGRDFAQTDGIIGPSPSDDVQARCVHGRRCVVQRTQIYLTAKEMKAVGATLVTLNRRHYPMVDDLEDLKQNGQPIPDPSSTSHLVEVAAA